MLKSITLKILEDVSKSSLKCDGCKRELSYWSRDHLITVANEKGWKYDDFEENIYCCDCQKRNIDEKV